ncbi:MAG: hypothetical protein QNK11_07690, partial [Legionella sp.]|nr:hypothetical protein [Legionella sp.]
MPININSVLDLYPMTKSDKDEEQTRLAKAREAFLVLQQNIATLGENGANSGVTTFIKTYQDINNEINNFILNFIGKTEEEINELSLTEQAALTTRTLASFASPFDSTHRDKLFALVNKSFNSVLEIDIEKMKSTSENENSSISALISF